MRSSFALLGFAATTLAQIPGLPTCAQTCISLPKDCQTTDFHCICTDSSFITGISCCVSQKCGDADQQTAIKFAQGLCGSYGATVPSQAGCSSGASPSSTAAASASSAVAEGTTGNGTTGGNSTITTTATNTISVTTTTTTSRQTGAAGNLGPQAGVVLGGVMAGMALL